MNQPAATTAAPLDLGPWAVSADAVRDELQEAAKLHDLDDRAARRISVLPAVAWEDD